MPDYLETHAIRKGTYKITTAFTDAAGSAVTPTSATWTLTDVSGTVINSREDVVMSPDTSIDTVLQGDDLDFQSGEDNSVERIFTVEAIYSSDEGDDLPSNKEIHFIIDDLEILHT